MLNGCHYLCVSQKSAAFSFSNSSLIFVYSLERPNFSPDSGSYSPFLSSLLALNTGWTMRSMRWVLFSPESVYGVGLCCWTVVGLAILYLWKACFQSGRPLPCCPTLFGEGGFPDSSWWFSCLWIPPLILQLLRNHFKHCPLVPQTNSITL